MARTSTYLNFPACTEEAFTFYKTVFQTDYIGPIHRFGEAPPNPEQPMAESEKNLIMHVALPILGGHVLMGTDTPEAMRSGHKQGTNVYLNLEPDTREEADRLFNALSEGGQIEMPIQDMFWGAYFGSLTDRFGVQWMINCMAAV